MHSGTIHVLSAFALGLVAACADGGDDVQSGTHASTSSGSADDGPVGGDTSSGGASGTETAGVDDTSSGTTGDDGSPEDPNDSADRIVFWSEDVVGMTDEDLDLWKSRGVDGFVIGVGFLRDMGGTQDFTRDPNHPLDGAEYDLQRALRDSEIVTRARDREIELYLGFYAANYYNGATPYAPWFDDEAWQELVLPKVADIAGAANLLGMAGLNIDQELYAQEGGSTASWYSAGPGANGDVAAKVRQRGEELMTAMVTEFPDLELMLYHFQLEESWEAVVQQEINGTAPADFRSYTTEMLQGLANVEGYGALRLQDAVFYKTPHVSGSTWDTALAYNANRLYAYFSRSITNWEYAAPRLSHSPFIWIDGDVENEGPFTEPRPPEYVAEQLSAFRRWGMDRQFSNYCYAALPEFDYAPYVEGLQDASTPGIVEQEPPTVSLTSPTAEPTFATSASSIDLAGEASDDMAIRYVHWESDRGGSGVAQMTWNVDAGDWTAGYEWHTSWTISAVPLVAGANEITVTAVDIKGSTSTTVLDVTMR